MPISTPNPTTGKLPIRDILPALLTLLALAAALKLQAMTTASAGCCWPCCF